jgi:UPF0755 protein
MLDNISAKQNNLSESKKSNKWIIWMLIILVIIGIFTYSYYIMTKKVTIQSTKTFEINQGEKVNQIAENLKNNGIINSIYVFKIDLVINHKSSKLQTGTFIFQGSLNTMQVINILTTQNTKNQVTFKEGMRIEEMGKYLESKGIVKSSDFIAEADNVSKYKSKYSFLSGLSANDSLEGFLFPDTYRFNPNATSTDIVDKMLENFNEKVYKNIASSLANKNENLKNVLILASIVEREVAFESERPVVAGIYQNRINQNMKLQADPTVQYAKDTQNPPQNYQNYWGKITAADYTSIISEYNTYLNFGFPPTPICNPGLSSIQAAINLTKSDYLYFFTNNGQIYYSKTAAEQLQKEKQYLK